MKKILLSLALASLAAVFASCGSSKQQPYPNYGYNQQPVQQQPVQQQPYPYGYPPQQGYYQQPVQQQPNLATTEQQPTFTRPVRNYYDIPCSDEAMDKPGEYMAGLGVSQNQDSEKAALLSANQIALSDIMTRFLGVVKNATEYYNKETNIGDDKGNKLQGLAFQVGEEVINKHSNTVCRKAFYEERGEDFSKGGYGMYVAVHVMIKDVVEEMVSETARRAAEIGLDYNQYKFKETMDRELYRNQEKELQKQKEKIENGEIE